AGCRVVHAEDIASDDGLLDDETRHGTNVGGIVAAVAPATDIVSLDVFDGGSAHGSDLVAAFDWAIENRTRYGIVAINLSLGTERTYVGDCDDSFFAAPLERAFAAGIAPIAASGNGASTNGISAPGCVTMALSVGAVYGAPAGSLTTEVCSEQNKLA